MSNDPNPFNFKQTLESGETLENPLSDRAAWNLMITLWVQFGKPKLESQEEPEGSLKIWGG